MISYKISQEKRGGIPKKYTITKTNTNRFFRFLFVTHPPTLHKELTIYTLFTDFTPFTFFTFVSYKKGKKGRKSGISVCEGGVSPFGYGNQVILNSAQKMRFSK